MSISDALKLIMKELEKKMIVKQISIVLFVFVLTSCASTGPNEKLNQAETTYESAQLQSGIQNTSAREMNTASEALEKAKSLHKNRGDKDLVDHYATVAMKNAEIAQEQLQLKQNRKEINKAKEKRQRLLLEARTQEVDNAREKAEQLAAELKELKAEQNKRGIILTLEDIIFAFDSAQLKPGGERIIGRIAEYLNDYPERNLLIEGFTDNIGSEQYNLDLSIQRAETVRRALVRNGVDRNRIKTTGLGESYPVASNSTAAGRQQNRRVEVIVANQDGSRISTR